MQCVCTLKTCGAKALMLSICCVVQEVVVLKIGTVSWHLCCLQEHASELYAQALVVLSNVTVPGNVKQALLVFSMAMVLYVAYVHIFYSLQKGV